jgi:hypothetical protein
MRKLVTYTGGTSTSSPLFSSSTSETYVIQTVITNEKAFIEISRKKLLRVAILPPVLLDTPAWRPLEVGPPPRPRL